MRASPFRALRAGAVALGFTAAFVYACGHDDVGGPVAGPVDESCKGIAQVTSLTACQPPPDAGLFDATDDGPPKNEEHPLPATDAGVRFNQSGTDEECKYDFTWSSTPITLNENVTFTLTVRNRTDGKLTHDADPQPEVFLDSTHPAPNSGAKTTELGEGTYSLGPIRFDQSGVWTVRFHVFDSCVRAEESPHTDVAFYVNVP